MEICPACGEGERKLVNHHCHLRNAVRDIARVLLERRYGRKWTDRKFATEPWTMDARVSALVRFDTIRICSKCNSLDSCNRPSLPGPYFSLSMVEMRELRNAVGGRRNRGKAVNRELARLRREAADEYHLLIRRAGVIGVDMAMEWLAASP